MTRIQCGCLLLVGALTLCGLPGWAQSPTSTQSTISRLEVAVSYDAARANNVPGYSFWMQGGSVQLCGQFMRHWGVAGDISGLYAGLMPHSGVGLDLVTAVFGPRYTLTSHSGRYRMYGQAMGGVTHGIDSIFPSASGATSSASGATLLLGGGVDYRLSRRLAYRVLDAAWLRTQLANGTTNVQNDTRLGTGVVFRF